MADVCEAPGDDYPCPIEAEPGASACDTTAKIDEDATRFGIDDAAATTGSAVWSTIATVVGTVGLLAASGVISSFVPSNSDPIRHSSAGEPGSGVVALPPQSVFGGGDDDRGHTNWLTNSDPGPSGRLDVSSIPLAVTTTNVTPAPPVAVAGIAHHGGSDDDRGHTDWLTNTNMGPPGLAVSSAPPAVATASVVTPAQPVAVTGPDLHEAQHQEHHGRSDDDRGHTDSWLTNTNMGPSGLAVSSAPPAVATASVVTPAQPVAVTVTGTDLHEAQQQEHHGGSDDDRGHTDLLTNSHVGPSGLAVSSAPLAVATASETRAQRVAVTGPDLHEAQHQEHHGGSENHDSGHTNWVTNSNMGPSGLAVSGAPLAVATATADPASAVAAIDLHEAQVRQTQTQNTQQQPQQQASLQQRVQQQAISQQAQRQQQGQQQAASLVAQRQQLAQQEVTLRQPAEEGRETDQQLQHHAQHDTIATSHASPRQQLAQQQVTLEQTAEEGIEQTEQQLQHHTQDAATLHVSQPQRQQLAQQQVTLEESAPDETEGQLQQHTPDNQPNADGGQMEQETQHLGGTHSQPAEEEQVQRQFQQQASTHDQVRTENTEDPMQQQLQHPTHQQRQALQRQEQPERHLQLLRGKQEEAHRRRRKNRLRSSEPSFHSRGTSRQQQRATHVSAPSSSRPSSIDGGATSAEVSGPSDFTTSAWSLDVAPSAGKPSREESGLYRTFANQLLPCVNDIISDKANSTTARSGTSNERTQKNGAPYVSEDALAAVFRAAFTGVVPIVPDQLESPAKQSVK